MAGCRIARQLLSAPAFAPWGTREYLPGPGVDDDAQWEAHIRRTSFLGYHPVGTCRMGNDDDAVVTPELAVRGVDGLSVADASVMPRLIAANTNAADLTAICTRLREEVAEMETVVSSALVVTTAFRMKDESALVASLRGLSESLAAFERSRGTEL